MASSSKIPLSSMLGTKWSSKMATYSSASILPSTSASCPTPSQPIHPHTIIFPPQSSQSPEPPFKSTPPPPASTPTASHLTQSCSFWSHLHSPLLVLQGKGQALLPMHCTEQWLFFFVTALNECFLRTFLTVCELTGWGMMVLMCLVA